MKTQLDGLKQYFQSGATQSFTFRLLQLKRLKQIVLENEKALYAAVQSRMIRIPRDSASLKHPKVSNLFPCGEGAGYAGGIMSAALDGIRVAQANI